MVLTQTLSISLGDFLQIELNFDNETSKWKNMQRGCAQRSSFGLLLWNIFQNSMSFYAKKSNLTIYAHDHQLYATGKNHESVRDIIQTEGQKALYCYRNNHLLANPERFQALTINPRGVDIRAIK